MIITIPISYQMELDHFKPQEIPNIEALQFKGSWRNSKYFSDEYNKIWHLSDGIVSLDQELKFGNIIPPELLSMSLAPACRKVKIEDFYYKAKSEILSRDSLKRIISGKLYEIKKKFSNKIALENTNYYPYSAYKHITQPDFITEVIEENDIYFCFDIAHAIVSAYNMGVHPQRYIRALPLHRCVEVHLSTPGIVGGMWRDLHEAPNSDIFNCLESCMDRLNKDIYVVIEYYRDFGVIRESYKELIRRFGCKE